MKKLFLFVAFALCSVLSFGGTIRFEKITDASKLQANDSVILVYETGKLANGGKMASKDYMSAVAITINSAGEVEMDEDVAKAAYMKLITSGSNWKIQMGGKYMMTKKQGDIIWDASATKTTYTYTWSIGISGGNITFGSTNSAYGVFRCNIDGTPFFRTYTSGYGEDVQLYRRISNQATSVTGVTLNKDELSMRVGDAAVTLTATVTPENATNKAVSWGSTNSAVASVANGTVSFVGVGTAKIWVKTEDGNKTDTCYVTVLKKVAEGNATWHAVQKAEYLPEGAKVFFGTIKANENYVMGQYVSGKNIKGVASTYGEDRHSVTAPLQVAYTVHIEDGKYVFEDYDGNYLRTMTGNNLGSGEKDDYAKWTLGTFDENDATIEVINTKNSSNRIFNNFQGTNDMFQVYSGIGDGSNIAKIVLYSDKAPAWQEREKHPSMVLSGEDVTIEGGKYVIDFGKVDKEEYTNTNENPWYVRRHYTITLTDLDEDINVTISEDVSMAFSLQISGETIAKNPTSTPKEVTRTIYWEAASKGTYTAKLTFHTKTAGVADIEVLLKVEAIDSASEPENQPQFSASVDHVYLNPNYEDNTYNDIQSFTFSAKNLQKNLYCKWAHTSSVLFDYAYQNQNMEIVVCSSDLAFNGTVNLETQDYTNEEVVLQVSGLSYVEKSYYQTYLQFYSFKKNSKTDYAIDVTIPVMIVISEEPAVDPTGVEDVQSDKVQCTKVIKDGQMLIIRNNEVYSVTGLKIND